MSVIKSNGKSWKNKIVRQHQTQIVCIVKEAINEIKWPRMEWKKNIFANHIFGKGFISSLYKRFTQLSRKKIKQLKYLNEQRKSKCFEKSEDQTVDERHFKFYLPKQKFLSSWHSFFYFQPPVWWLKFTGYIFHSIAITLHWAMCAQNSPTNYKNLIITYLILRHLKFKVIFRTLHSIFFYILFQNWNT